MTIKVDGGDDMSKVGNYKPWVVSVDEYLSLYSDAMGSRKCAYKSVFGICNLNDTPITLMTQQTGAIWLLAGLRIAFAGPYP